MFNFQVFEEVSAGDLVMFAFESGSSHPSWAMSYRKDPRSLADDLAHAADDAWDPTRDNPGEFGPYADAAEMVEQYNFICAAIDAREYADPQFWTLTYDSQGVVNRDLWGPMMSEAMA